MTNSTFDTNEMLDDANMETDGSEHLDESAVPPETHDISGEPETNEAEQRQARQEKRQEAVLLASKLSEHYPAIFPKTGSGRPVALAIGLHKELLPIVQAWGFSTITLRSVLSWYTRQLRYQRALLFSEHRVNLDGTPGEKITEEQKALAQENITKIEIWLSEHKPAKAKKLADRKAQVAEQKKKRSGDHPGLFKKKHATDKPKSKGTTPGKRKEEPKTTSAESMSEKMQGLLSKFNQH